MHNFRNNLRWHGTIQYPRHWRAGVVLGTVE